nr:hypothetical protein CFP56_20942 [Quercus suber]
MYLSYKASVDVPVVSLRRQQMPCSTCLSLSSPSLALIEASLSGKAGVTKKLALIYHNTCDGEGTVQSRRD